MTEITIGHIIQKIA